MEMTHPHYTTETEPWLPDQSSADGVHYMPKLIQRRAKRVIPPDEKDDKYWEKRKRNNMAAKRSRENKRKLEIDIRQKVTYLEEDNALLRKEVSLIKAKFGIPLDQSLLTAEERAQCMREVKAAQAAQASPRDDDDDTNSDGVYPVSLLAISSTNNDDEQNTHMLSENSDHDRNLTDDESRSESAHVPARRGQSVYSSYSMAMSWGSGNQQYNPHAYNNNNNNNNNAGQHLPHVNNAFADKTPVVDNSYPRYGAQQENQYRASPYEYYHPVFANQSHVYNGANALQTPADLTTSRNKRMAVGNDVILNKHEEQVNSVGGLEPDVMQGQMPATHDMYSGGRQHQVQMTMSDSTNSDCIDESVKRENVELKEKLRTLTCQVEKMKNIVLKE